MFGIGETELLIIVVFAFMLFGPDKLPGMGRTIGRALRQFRTAQEDFTSVVQAEVVDPMTSAMSEPGKKTRPSGPSAAGDDADIEGADATTRPKSGESFAERKARLKAERGRREAEAAAAAEQEAAEQAEGEESGPEGDAPAAEATDDATAPAEDSGSDEATETVPDTSAAALYAMAPRRRAEKDDPAPDAEVTTPDDQAADDEPAETDGKEDGDEAE